MAEPNTTPHYQLEKPEITDFYDVEVQNRNLDKIDAALADPARHFTPCTTTYSPTTHRHTLTPSQGGLALPDVFAVRFVAAAGFAAGDTLYLDGVEYTPAYTDSTKAVEAGRWRAGAVVEVTLDKVGRKAYVGEGLEGKVNGKWTTYSELTELGITLGAETIEAIAKAMPDRSEICYVANTVTGSAAIYPAAYGTCRITRILGHRIDVDFRELGTGKAWLGKLYLSNSPAWAGWVEQATATPPQEFDLPLVLNYTKVPGYKCCYSKAQDGLVLVHLAVQMQSGNPVVAGTHLFTKLPVGFWPAAAVGHTNDQLSIAINPNGDIGGHVFKDIQNLAIAIPFYAAS